MLSDATRSEIEALTTNLLGWCPLEKAITLAELVLTNDAQLVVEVGTFGGRSFFPMVQALKQKGTGHAYGVEPFSNTIAVESTTSPENDAWWSNVDMAQVKGSFLGYMIQQNLTGTASLIELASDDAYEAFTTRRFRGKLDLIHIDGSHSAEQAMRDVVKWSELLRPGGFFVVDDIAWPGLESARTWLTQTHTVIDEVFTELATYGVYRKAA